VVVVVMEAAEEEEAVVAMEVEVEDVVGSNDTRPDTSTPRITLDTLVLDAPVTFPIRLLTVFRKERRIHRSDQ
jgi:hypothetical protein